MSAPKIIADGNFNFAQQNGPTSYKLPFADKGDFRSFQAINTMRVAAAKYTTPFVNSLQTFPLGNAYLSDMTAPSEVQGGALLEWQEIFASIPQPRSEYGSITYTQQYISTSVLGDRSIIDWTQTRDGRILYEYSLNTPLARILAPVLIEFASIIYFQGGWGTFTPGQEILAQDTTSEIYLGKIYCRKSVLVPYNPLIVLT